MKWHEYLAKRDSISIEEAARRSLARVWDLSQSGKVMALITAFVDGLDYEQNTARNQRLFGDIRAAKFGSIPLYGFWTYHTAEGDKKVQEDSFLVSASEKIPNKNFKSIILSWLQKYEQESAVVKYADSDIAYKLEANGVETQLGTWHANKPAEFYSQMKKGNRTFVFEAADNFSWSARLACSSIGGDAGN